jgi:hypothetical protein
MEHTLPQEFFAIQLAFAERVAQVCGLSLGEAVYTYTVCRPQFLAEPLERSDLLWREFVEGLERANDRAAYTHGFYLAHRAHYDVPCEGCFYYSFWPEGAKIRLHFVNNDRSGQGALSKERMPVRLAELHALFADVREKYPQAATLRGGSWLYNLPAYCRLFPKEYVATAARVEDEFNYMALWGQFLRGGYERLNERQAALFLQRVAQQTTWEGLRESFPFQVLRPEASLEHCYRFYRL